MDSAPYNDKSFNWVASLTKLLTSISVLQLVEKGLVSLDQDLRPLVPELRDARILIEMDDNNKGVLEPNSKPITFRHLLTHTAGYSYEFANPTLLAWSKADGRDLRHVHWSKKESDTPLCFAPGESWEYGVNLDWAGQALEKITGQALDEYIQQHICKPLGMKDTTFWPEKLPHTQTKDRKVKFSLRHPKTGRLEPTDWSLPEKHEMESGGGGLYTTAADYAAVLRGLLQGRLLKTSTMDEMVTPQLTATQREKFEMIAFHPMVHNTFAPEFKEGTKIDHGLAGMLNTQDVPGKRRANSIAWSGIHNSRWVGHKHKQDTDTNNRQKE